MEPPDGRDCKKPKSAAASAVEAAGDDVLGEILLRLPDTASLARAALARKRWRRVASDPALLRRFHSLHEPPLLGFIMWRWPPPRPQRIGYEYPDHKFLPAPARNPHIAAATGATDCNIQDFTAKNPRSGGFIDRWVLRGCDGGRFLLSYTDFYHREELAVYDPIARTAKLLAVVFNIGNLSLRHYVLVAGEADSSFRVFAVQIDMFDYRLRASLFSSRTGEWASLPDPSLTLRPIPPPPTPRPTPATIAAFFRGVVMGGGMGDAASGPWDMRDGMRAGRFAYWKSNTDPKRCGYGQAEGILVLDTTTMEWTIIEAPFFASTMESYCVADIAEQGGLCLVASKEQRIQLWVRNSDGWVIKKQTFLLKEFAVLKVLRLDEWMKRVRILEVRDGYVYMEFWTIRMPNSYLLVLNWQTMKLRVLANDTDEKYRGPAFPFFMTWAPPLLSPGEAEASSSRLT